MNIRLCRDGSYRGRIYHLHKEQIELIQMAFERARMEGGSDFDSVALERICMSYLSVPAPISDSK